MLCNLWADWRGVATLPPVKRFDPQAVADLMPWIVLLDIVPDAELAHGYDLESRFIGSAFSQYFSADHGQRVRFSVMGAPYADRWFEVVDLVLTEGGCCSFQGAPYKNNLSFARFEMCVLPFTTDDARLDSLLLAFAMSAARPDDQAICG